MRARLVVFPIKGRNWCFSRSIDKSIPSNGSASSSASQVPTTFRELYNKISSSSKPLNSNAELLVDFVSNKMNRAWTGLEKAPEGTFKNRLYGLGIRLLARVKPSEIFLKSITKDVSSVEITYPMSLNDRLVRRRLRHIAYRGYIIHKKLFYGSVTLLPVTSALVVLPLPNVPFFWVLFRTYSHWRALQGSEKLLQLVSDSSRTQNLDIGESKKAHDRDTSSNHGKSKPLESAWVLRPSEELEKFLHHSEVHGSLSDDAILDICKKFELNKVEVFKCRDLV